MGEGKVQPGSQNDIIFLQRGRGGRRIGAIDIAEGILPSQPFARILVTLPRVEGYAILAGIAEVREKVKFLRSQGRCAEFTAEFLAQSDGKKIPLQSNVTFSRIVRANQKVQRGSIKFRK